VNCDDFDSLLTLAADGSLDASGWATLREHEGCCAACGEVSRARLQLEAGDKVSRYRLLEPLAEGGMGVVWLAEDADLGRTVALKLLRPDRPGLSSRALVKEARAMARLSHPNVVTVHEVGTERGQVFLAMERIDGISLEEWLGTPRRWREVVRVFLQAGEGLSAIHAAGLVHRDFKPSNVLVSSSGVVKVADLGLVTRPGESGKGPLPPGGSSQTGWSVDSGQVAGTPGYMAPEQLAGRAVLASDQFAFCVSLAEAFERTGARAPGWVKRVLARGVDPEAARRFPGMDSLLARLRRGLVGRPLGLAAAAAVGLLSTSAAWWMARPSPCLGFEKHLESRWDAPRRAEVEAAFVAADPRRGRELFKAAARELDRYAGRWVEAQRAACVASRVTGEQSEEMLDRRTGCLQDRLRLLGAVTSTLAGPLTQQEAQRAVYIAGALTPLESCADVSGVLSQLLPVPPQKRAHAEALRDELARIDTQRLFGRYAAVMAAAPELEKRALALDVPALVARAIHRTGDAQMGLDRFEEASRTYRRALVPVVKARDAETEALIYSNLVQVLGEKLTQHAQAELVSDLAHGALERAGVSDRVRITVKMRLGLAANSRGNHQEALAVLQGLLPRIVELDGADSMGAAVLQANLGVVLRALGRDAEAAPLLEKAAAIYEARLGSETEERAGTLNSLANAYKEMARYDDAEAGYGEALRIRESLHGEHHSLVGTVINNLGTLAQARGRQAEAVAYYRRAVEIYEKSFGPRHANLAMSLSNLGGALSEAGDAAQALPLLVRAVEIYDQSGGARVGHHAEAIVYLGEVLGQLGRLPEAERELRRSVALLESKLDVRTRLLVPSLCALAELSLRRGGRGEARALLARAREIAVQNPLEPYLLTKLNALVERARG
jgi:tetratricopeptide (TPR) repeat protein